MSMLDQLEMYEPDACAVCDHQWRYDYAARTYSRIEHEGKAHRLRVVSASVLEGMHREEIPDGRGGTVTALSYGPWSAPPSPPQYDDGPLTAEDVRWLEFQMTRCELDKNAWRR